MTEAEKSTLDLLSKLNDATKDMLKQVMILDDQLTFESRIQSIDNTAVLNRKPAPCLLCELGIPRRKAMP